MVYQTNSSVANNVSITEQEIQEALARKTVPTDIVKKTCNFNQDKKVSKVILIIWCILALFVLIRFHIGGLIIVILASPIGIACCFIYASLRDNPMEKWKTETREAIIFNLFILKFKSEMENLFSYYQHRVEYYHNNKEIFRDLYFNRDTGLISVTNINTGEHFSRNVYTKADMDLYRELFNTKER